jgi:diphthine-ammonia ligase
MYQTVGYQVIEGLAECMELPIVFRKIHGKPVVQSLSYSSTEEDEVEDLYLLLKEVKERFPDIEAVSCGAILSTYQRNRVENVCTRLGLISLSYLWRRDQQELLKEMIDCGVDAIILKVAAMGFVPNKHLGKTLKELYPTICNLNRKYELHVCGEGGEYESLVLDCPLFKKKIVIDELEIVTHSDDAFAAVAFLRILKYHTEPKPKEQVEISEIFKNLEISKTAENLENEESASEPVQKLNIINLAMNCGGPNNASPNGKQSRSKIRGNFMFVTASAGEGSSFIQSTEHVFQEISGELNKHNATFDDVLFVNVYVKDMSNFGTLNKIYGKYFGLNPAARACIQAFQMVEDVIIDAYVLLPNKQEKPDASLKKALHVQSISEWAPACIGPYSQAITVDKYIYLAGQIALYPPTMQIVSPNIVRQSNQVLKSIGKVMEAVSTNFNFCINFHVFVVDFGFLPVLRSLMLQTLQRLGESDGENLPNWKPLITISEIGALPRNADVEILVTCLHNSVDADILRNIPVQHYPHPSQKFYCEQRGLILPNDSENSVIPNLLQCTLVHTSSSDDLDITTELAFFAEKLNNFQGKYFKNWDEVLSMKILYNYQLDNDMLQHIQPLHVQATFIPVRNTAFLDSSTADIHTTLLCAEIQYMAVR